MNGLITKEYKKGEEIISPNSKLVKNWVFTSKEEAEALLASSMALVAEKNEMSANDLMHLFPAVLRMLKSNSMWSK